MVSVRSIVRTSVWDRVWNRVRWRAEHSMWPAGRLWVRVGGRVWDLVNKRIS